MIEKILALTESHHTAKDHSGHDDNCHGDILIVSHGRQSLSPPPRPFADIVLSPRFLEMLLDAMVCASAHTGKDIRRGDGSGIGRWLSA